MMPNGQASANSSQTQVLPVSRFHEHKGSNVLLLENRSAARRHSSFANGLAFSEKPLLPGELFLLEIEQNERGWSGFLRMGLTQLNPEDRFPLPQYALPDLSNLGHTWVFAVTKTHNSINDYIIDNAVRCPNIPKRLEMSSGDFMVTPRGPVPKSLLVPSDASSTTQLPTDVGSRVGLMFVPNSPTLADMHFILNGEDQGACCSDIPYGSRPLYAVIDIYGSTKQVKIIQLYGVPTLQGLCRDAILQNITRNAIKRLPLPKMLKEYLQFKI